MGLGEFEDTAALVFKSIILPIICIYLAGLNLWLLFKDWFNERFEEKQAKENPNKRVGRVGLAKVDERQVSIMGESKYNIEKEAKKQSQLEQEIKILKDELEEIKKNQIIHSIPLEKEVKPPPDNRAVSSEEEFLILAPNPGKMDTELSSSQSFTMDEFGLMAKSLSGKVVTRQEEKLVAEIIPKMKGTDMYQQFIGQVKGAEGRAMEILRMAEDNESDNQSGMGNLSKFIRT